MEAFSDADRELARRQALRDLDVLDTPSEREFDEITSLAASALGARSAAISLVDDERQWFKARHNIPFAETSREIAFCDRVVTQRTPLVILDATLDARVRDNPLVTADGGIRFYAGAPLFAASGDCIGTLCVFDPQPRETLSADHQAVLERLAAIAAQLLRTRSARRMAEIAAKVVAATSDAILASDGNGKIVYWNSAAERMFQRSQAEALGQDLSIIIPPRLAAAHSKGFARAAGGGQTSLVGATVELSGLRADGEEFPLELSLARWGGEGAGGFAAIIRDITGRVALERSRQQDQALLDNVITNLPAMVFLKDAADRRYLKINRVGETVMGLPADRILGATDRQLFPEVGAGYETRDIEATASTGRHVFESEFVRQDGTRVNLRTTRTVIDGPDRARQYILGISEDVTEVRQAEAEVRRLGRYDSLTGLLNRASYASRLGEMVRAGATFALLSIDLDRFKSVNDHFGQQVADRVLAQAGERLKASVGSGWTARIGGDEFIAVIQAEALADAVRALAGVIIAELARPFAIDDISLSLSASIGVVFAPSDGTAVEELQEKVDLALHRAKREGRGRTCFFDTSMDAAARDRRALENDLRDAVAAGAIRLNYQPVVSAETGRITSAEALARWTHPTRGPIRPDVFIALAEEIGLIDPLGEQLLRQACADAQAWPRHVRVAVNLSPLQFLSGTLVETVRLACADAGFDTTRLQLEVTEGLVIRDVEGTFRQLEALRAIGVQVLIDDFGVGYSSLSYFQRFPFDKVKIDKSFVDEIQTSRAVKAIVQAVTGLGGQLGMGVVAEGVETVEQMEMLIACGCTHLQGYLFGRPLPNGEFLQLVDATSPKPAAAALALTA